MKDMTHGNARGASTITQQLVKNPFQDPFAYSTRDFSDIFPAFVWPSSKAKNGSSRWRLNVPIRKRTFLPCISTPSISAAMRMASKRPARPTSERHLPEYPSNRAATLVGFAESNHLITILGSIRRTAHVVVTSYWRIWWRIISSHARPRFSENAANGAANTKWKTTTAAMLCISAKPLPIRSSWCKKTTWISIQTVWRFILRWTRLQAYAEYAVDKQMRRIQRNFNEHWRGQNPWKDEKEDIPNFIEDLAKRTNTYKQLMQRYPNRPDSVDYFLNLPHRLKKVFDYDLGLKIRPSAQWIPSVIWNASCTAASSLDPHSGEVKAWVGDVNFNSWKYDKVLSKRQPGSTFNSSSIRKLWIQSCLLEARRDEPINGKSWKRTTQTGSRVMPMDTMYDSATFESGVRTTAIRLRLQVAKQIGIHILPWRQELQRYLRKNRRWVCFILMSHWRAGQCLLDRCERRQRHDPILVNEDRR